MSDAIVRATVVAGGQASLAVMLDVAPATVNQWVKKKRPIPADRCPDIEAFTGVRCEDLRPDVNWYVLRGTAADAQGQPLLAHREAA
jgi:DNA-binding transcriptional regulator YdaS (Cro superfamily)